MSAPTFAARAYRASSAHRSLREQEADVFRHALGALQAARNAGSMVQTRALADNRRLWGTVIDLMRDPDNRLPAALRAQIVSLGLAVQRDMDSEAPDWGFLIQINEHMVASLAGAN